MLFPSDKDRWNRNYPSETDVRKRRAFEVAFKSGDLMGLELRFQRSLLFDMVLRFRSASS